LRCGPDHLLRLMPRAEMHTSVHGGPRQAACLQLVAVTGTTVVTVLRTDCGVADAAAMCRQFVEVPSSIQPLLVSSGDIHHAAGGAAAAGRAAPPARLPAGGGPEGAREAGRLRRRCRSVATLTPGSPAAATSRRLKRRVQEVQHHNSCSRAADGAGSHTPKHSQWCCAARRCAFVASIRAPSQLLWASLFDQQRTVVVPRQKSKAGSKCSGRISAYCIGAQMQPKPPLLVYPDVVYVLILCCIIRDF
jgi:hypothetical protein